MDNFEFLSPTRIIFGRGGEDRVGTEIKKRANRVLLHYGGGSIKRSGLYDRVKAALAEAQVDFIELGGVQPNPRLSLVETGIALGREAKIDFILAVGGGSVIDSAKAIGLGIPYDGNVWDFFQGKAIPNRSIPLGVIVTAPGAGSEASKSCVITNEKGWIKRATNSFHNRPVFAILNPELTFTLSSYQTACGAADIMAHVMERYFTTVPNVDYTDRLCEATLKTMIYNVPIVLEEPLNYDARAQIMWASTLAHNDLLETGRTSDWASHLIEHELSGVYDVVHGAGLAVILPAWMKYVYKHDVSRFVRFAVEVWSVDQSYREPERTALEGIRRTEMFFRSIGLPTTLKDLEIPLDRLEELADKCFGPSQKTLGYFLPLNRQDVLSILENAK